MKSKWQLLCLALFAPVLAAQTPAPKLVTENGRHALMVDGTPYLVLGAQINNSSAWPGILPEVWPALEAMHVNTAEAPVYWEQIEARPGTFDWTSVDALIDGARAHHLHLILLWFGTWKNGNDHYAPQWVKADTKRFPRMRNRWGTELDVLSANAESNLEADRTAFASLMRHVAARDATEHTVLMVQVENESGAVGTVRDYSPDANRAFAGAVPAALGKGTWSEVFGGDADEAFQAYTQARYVNAVVEAGKREFAIPMYCNVWVQYPPGELPERHIAIPGIGYPAGGPVQTMLGLWKAAAPAIDAIGPDLYSSNPEFTAQVLDTYARPDNPLWVPESGLDDVYAPAMFQALGRGAIGFSPFGVDWTGWGTLRTGAVAKAHAENFALLGGLGRTVAKLNYAGAVRTVVEGEGGADQSVVFGGDGPGGRDSKELASPAKRGAATGLPAENPVALANATVPVSEAGTAATRAEDTAGAWVAEVRFGLPQKDGAPAPGTKDHSGRMMVARMGANEFLLTGVEGAVFLHRPGFLPGIRMEIVSAEEGYYEPANPEVWHRTRLLNGDQTDRGIQFPESFAEHAGEVGKPVAVRLTVARLGE